MHENQTRFIRRSHFVKPARQNLPCVNNLEMNENRRKSSTYPYN